MSRRKKLFFYSKLFRFLFVDIRRGYKRNSARLFGTQSSELEKRNAFFLWLGNLLALCCVFLPLLTLFFNGKSRKVYRHIWKNLAAFHWVWIIARAWVLAREIPELFVSVNVVVHCRNVEQMLLKRTERWCVFLTGDGTKMNKYLIKKLQIGVYSSENFSHNAYRLSVQPSHKHLIRQTIFQELLSL